MPSPILDVIAMLDLAHQQACLLLSALQRLMLSLDNLSDNKTHASWEDLLTDVDCIERRLRGALSVPAETFTRDPATYTPPPRNAHYSL
jgi:hypothetical protein